MNAATLLTLFLLAASAHALEIGAGQSTRPLDMDIYASVGPLVVEWIDEGRQPCCPNRNRLLLVNAKVETPRIAGLSAYGIAGWADGEWSINSTGNGYHNGRRGYDVGGGLRYADGGLVLSLQVIREHHMQADVSAMEANTFASLRAGWGF